MFKGLLNKDEELTEEVITKIKDIYLNTENVRNVKYAEAGVTKKLFMETVEKYIQVEDISNPDKLRKAINKYPDYFTFSRLVKNPLPYRLTFSIVFIALECGPDDIKHMYIDEGKSSKEIAELVDIPYIRVSVIKDILKNFNIRADKEVLRKKARRMYRLAEEKDPGKWARAKVKQEETIYKKFGVDNVFRRPEVIKRIKVTKTAKYGKYYNAITEPEFTSTEYARTLGESRDILSSDVAIQTLLDMSGVKHTVPNVAKLLGRLPSGINWRLKDKAYIERASVGQEHAKMQSFLESLGFVEGTDFIVNDRTAIKPQEIDFYFHKQKVGIEVNDLLTHNSTYSPYTEDRVKPKNYHIGKSKVAKEKGIRLIHAWEHYFDNPDQYEVLKNAIKHALGISKYRVYARNTYVKEVPNTSLKDFFNKNNIQGFRGAKTAYALFDKKTDEVLMAYSVGNPHFSHQKYDLELIRGASKIDTTIVGGASKLWKYIIDNNPEVNSIVYYIDRNIYNGSSISTLEGNLELVSTQVGFWNYFVDTKEMKNRQPKHHKEIKELVEQGKVWEVYNAGTETYVWTRS